MTDAATLGKSKSPKQASKSPPKPGELSYLPYPHDQLIFPIITTVVIAIVAVSLAIDITNSFVPVAHIDLIDAAADVKTESNSKPDGSSNAEPGKPLAPPPRPGQQQGTDTPDFFNGVSGSLSLEPNPFEQSFGGGGPETPGGTKLPPLAALTSPSSLLPGASATPFAWGGGSLRTGPLSPAMLSGPQTDYFGDTHHLRGGFPTPNESSLRTGLTPGGSGSMFPAASPNSQALYAQLASGGATPSTLDFHRTAISAAAKREQPSTTQAQTQQSQQSVTSQPQEMPNGAATIKSEPKPASGPFDPHDNDAANGLFMLAQGRNGAQSGNHQYPVSGAPNHAHPAPVAGQNMKVSPQMSGVNGGSTEPMRDVSEGSNMTDESEQVRPNTRAKGKRNGSTTNTRRKAEELPEKAPPSKKMKGMNGVMDINSDSEDDDDTKIDENGTKTKMTDEEKRKNFLERNRYVP